MDYTKLKKLKALLYFGIADISRAFNIQPKSAHVLCSRYVKNGLFIRLKKDFYVLDQNWDNLSIQDFFKISNYLQVPSYISFMTALSFYEVTTQVPRGLFESASLKRSIKFTAGSTNFNFYKLKKELYSGFIKKNNLFIATAEKAFVDSLYLYSFGKYKIDLAAIDMRKLDRKKVRAILKIFPERTRLTAGKICGI